MKRLVCMCLLIAMAVSLCAGCSKQGKEISCADVIAAYEEAGYEVEHWNDPNYIDGWICEVSVEKEDGDSIRFYFFETQQEATAYAEEHKWNVVLWLYTVAMFQPTWLATETYGNMAIEYDDQDLYQPFKTLVKQK